MKKIKIVFVIPPLPRGLNSDISPREKIPHIGIAYLISSLKSSFPHVEIALIDGEVEKWSIKRIVKKIMNISPDVVGISSSTQHARVSQLISSNLKKEGFKGSIIWGGWHISALPIETMKECPSIDAGVIGEGEKVFPLLIEYLREGSNVEGVKGVIWREGDNVKYDSLLPTRIEDVDSLPFPDFAHFKLSKYIPYYTRGKILPLPVLTSRGCPYHCIFCFKTMGEKVRFRSVESVIEEVERDLQVYGANQIVFLDENFTLNRKRTLLLCESILKKGLHKRMKWVCETRVDLVDKEVLKMMKRAGCMLVAYGVESGSERILKEIKKEITLSQVKETVKLTKEVGLRVDLNFMIGLPNETRKDIESTLNLIDFLEPDYISIGIAVPYPGTSLWEMAKRGEGGLKLLTTDWAKYGKQIGRALELENVPRLSLELYQIKGYLKFFLKKGRIKNLFEVANPLSFFVYFLHLCQSVGIEMKRKVKRI